MEVSGTAVGIASLGIQVCKGLLQYYVSWKGYTDDIRSTYDCIQHFENTLILLGKTVTTSNPSQEILKHITECIIACESGIERLKMKFEKIKQKTPDNKNWLVRLEQTEPGAFQLRKTVENAENLRRQIHFQRQRLIYPFQESTLVKLREIVSELQGNLLTAISALNIDVSSAALEKLDALEQQTATLSSASLVIRTTVDQSAQQTSQILQSQRMLEYEKACAWLSAPNPFTEYNKGIKEHHRGTGAWFLDSEAFETWKSSPGSTCWIHGKPGCGKTVLSSLVVRQLKSHVSRSPNAVLAYFFFNVNDKTKTKVHKLVRSIVLQICVQLPNGHAELADFYARHSNNFEDIGYSMLLSFLQGLLSAGRVFLIFDALDECEEVEEMVEFIRMLLLSYSDRVSLFLTSRNEDRLRSALAGLVSVDIDFENENVEVDIRNFIHESVTGDEELGSWSEDAQEEIADALIAGADCMFRWVALQLEELRKCYTLDVLRQTLRSLPRGLEDTYVRILSDISEYNRPVVLKLLYWITFAEMPLDLAAAAEAIKLEINDEIFYSDSRRLRNPRTVLRLCPSLITLIQRTDPADPEYLTLSHASVKEFLLSGRIRNEAASFFHISRIEAPLYIAESCVAYLLHISRELEEHCSEDWYWQKFKRYPLLEYARIFWDTHVRKTQTKDSQRLNAFVLEYVSSRLLREISAGFSTNMPYPFDLPPLQKLAELGFVHSVEDLLDAGYEINTPTSDGWTPISVAVAAERLDIIELLISHGASLDPAPVFGHSVDICGLAIRMFVGMERSSDKQLCESIAVRLLKEGAAPAAREAEAIWHHILDHGDAPAVKELFKIGLDSRFQPEDYGSLLRYAALMHLVHFEGLAQQQHPESLTAALLRDDLDKIQLLLEHCASTEVLDNEGRTVLLFVFEEANNRFGHVPKIFLVEICELLLDSGADIHAMDKRGWTLLHWAAAYMDVDLVYMLLQRGAWQDGERWLALLHETPLHSAIIHSNDESVVRALLEYGIPVNAADAQGGTALGYAIQAYDERPGIVQLLVEYGACFDDAEHLLPPEQTAST